MDYYSNEASLKATFGVAEVDGLMTPLPEPAIRLDKAARTAYDEINGYLRTGGYVVPFTFTPFQASTPAVVDSLDGKLQEISDVFTAWYLAASEDLMKKVYEDRRAAGIAWLEKVAVGDITIGLTLTDQLSGAGDVVVLARPQVNTMNLVNDITIARRTWPNGSQG